MKRLANTCPILTLRRLLLLYGAMLLVRVAFVLYNADIFGDFAAKEFAPLLLGALQFDTASLLYANGLWIVLSLLPLRIRERRWWCEMLFWYYAVVNTLVLAVNMSDAVYFRYTQKRFTAEELFFADNSNSAALMLKFALENWYLVLAWAVLSGAVIWGYRRRAKVERLLQGWAYYVGSTAVLILTVWLSVCGIRGGFTRMTRPIAIPNAMQYAADVRKANIVLSNPFCIIRTAGSGHGGERTDFFTVEELDEIYTPCHFPDGSGGGLEGRNVVIFIMESFSAEHSAYLCGDIYADEQVKGYTPFLDSLMREGFTFHRMYANGKRSIQALPTVWSSIPSYRTPFMLMPEALGESKPLPRILREDKGYDTAFFCGSERGSMGFGAYASAAGFERQYAMEDYKRRHGADGFDGYWGIWDAPFLQYMGEELDRMREPFLASVFTLSSHHPFVVPDELRDSLPAGHTRIHRCVAYTDYAVRRFFEANSGKEWFRNTVFVFVADHVSSEKFAPRTRTAPFDLHIVGFIYTPDGAVSGEYGHTASQVDIMPTLLGLLGYDKPYFAYGRDVLNEPCAEPMALSFDNGSYIVATDDCVCTFADGRMTSVYALDDTERSHDLLGTLPTERLERLERRVKAAIQQYYRHAALKRYTVE